MNNIHCIPVGNGEPLHECHTLCWCYPVTDPASAHLYGHNAKDCREKWERQGLEMPPLSLWVTVEEKDLAHTQKGESAAPQTLKINNMETPIENTAAPSVDVPRLVRLRALNPRFQCPKKYCRAQYDMDSLECPECGHDAPRIVAPSGALMTLGEWCD